ncbi:hypothetical protein MPH_13346, partial [Macrophomina phaseolina MS6]
VDTNDRRCLTKMMSSNGGAIDVCTVAVGFGGDTIN